MAKKKSTGKSRKVKAGKKATELPAKKSKM